MRNRREVLAFGMAVVLARILSARADSRPLRLLLVHGRGQGGLDPAQLQAQWIEALSQGAQNLGRALPNSIEVAFPYYGDTLDRIVHEFDLPLTSDVHAKGGGADNEFLAFQAEIAQAVREKAGVTDNEVAVEYGNNPRPRGPLNWEWVQAIFRAIDKQGGGMSQAALEAFTRDVFLYTTRTGVRDAIDDIVKKQVTDQPTVVVGHSLGSIVAYNVLRSDPRTLRVPLLVTVGSPLGIRAVRDQLVPLKFPNSVHAWYNAFDNRDVVALYPLDNANFPVTPPIVNNGKVKNHTDNRHGIIGYLDDKEVAQQILDALGS
jgi:hypothetical protein